MSNRWTVLVEISKPRTWATCKDTCKTYLQENILRENIRRRDVLIRTMILLGLVSASLGASAQTVAQSFKWRVSGRFALTVVKDGVAQELAGDLREGGEPDTVTLKDAGFEGSEVKAFPGFVLVELVVDSSDIGKLFIFERQNANFNPLNIEPINTRAAGFDDDLGRALDSLKRINNWEAAPSFRAMLDYFKQSPSKQLSDFADDAGLERINTVAKPKSRVQLPDVQNSPDVTSAPAVGSWPSATPDDSPSMADEPPSADSSYDPNYRPDRNGNTEPGEYEPSPAPQPLPPIKSQRRNRPQQNSADDDFFSPNMNMPRPRQMVPSDDSFWSNQPRSNRPNRQSQSPPPGAYPLYRVPDPGPGYQRLPAPPPRTIRRQQQRYRQYYESGQGGFF